MTDLYRFYDGDDRLLYVGISLHAAKRASEHRHDKPWWPDVVRMDVEHLGCARGEAEAIERGVIVAERPLHNIVHNTVQLTSRRDRPVRLPNTDTQQAVFDALMTLMDATGGYPMTRADILDAIRQGVNDAVSEHLDTYGLAS